MSLWSQPRTPRSPVASGAIAPEPGLRRAAAGCQPAPRPGRVPRKADGVAADQMDYLFADDGPAPDPAPGPAARPKPGGAAAHPVVEILSSSEKAGMDDDAVRELLAERLCRLLPELPPSGRDKMTALALRALEQLARDHVTKVRAALASAIKDIACAPPDVVNTLARDVERSVAEPVLHYCATLTDNDLLSIIAARGESWALSAIARRHRVSGAVSAAIADTGDAEATGILLDNSGAAIPDATLERLVEHAVERREWQGKLARRPGLPRRLALRLACFVDRSLLETLRSRPDFDDETVEDIVTATRRRVDWVEERDPTERPEQRAVRLHRMGLLDETAIGDALSWEELGFVRTALALRAGVAPVAVDGIIASRNAKAVTALAWRAGLSMRAAMQIQARAANIPPRSMLNARQGTDYPLTPPDMMRTLALYGVEG